MIKNTTIFALGCLIGIAIMFFSYHAKIQILDDKATNLEKKCKPPIPNGIIIEKNTGNQL